ncbi:recombinase family protein [Microtetraspora fusca]|uniref:Recombinase family protein n=1 Tax=Microtetraspora fusca TaxID=1997 RepID=A0ABW6UWU9_MICFU
MARRSGARRGQATREDWTGERAAIYCRISHAKDEDQTGVDRQERICRNIADRLGLVVTADHVFVDNNRSAWQRNRKRKGWDALLEVAREAGVRHIITYHPDRLMRQPRDLEELLTIADDHNITLHGEANKRDLSDPDDRFFLRIEVAHACRSSDDTSRRLKSAFEERARDGKPHTGRRSYGYTKDGMAIVPEEAAIVREIFDRYLDGEAPEAITRELNRRGVPTAMGKKWVGASVRRVLDSPVIAGIRVFRGEEIGQGEWPAIIDLGTFREVAERRTYRSAVFKAEAASKPVRFYLLRSLVTCKNCGTRMGGGPHGAHRTYVCTSNDKTCSRRIKAEKLESFVVDAAIDLLERLEVTGREASALLPEADAAAIEADRAELAELKDMWDAQEIKTREYRQMRKVIEDRIAKLEAKTIVRPIPEILKGIAGPDARSN